VIIAHVRVCAQWTWRYETGLFGESILLGRKFPKRFPGERKYNKYAWRGRICIGPPKNWRTIPFRPQLWLDESSDPLRRRDLLFGGQELGDELDAYH
jgi:hypothetical protein